jgi:hypothetical protein
MLLCGGLGVASILDIAGGQATGEFVELFDGTLGAWTIENSDMDNFRIVDGLLRVEAPHGWLRYAAEFRDFRIDIEFRFLTDDADSGVFFRAGGTEPFSRGWPNESYQLQMLNPLSPSRFQPLGGLFRHGMPEGETRFDEAAARAATRPTGEWQRLEFEVVGDTVRAWVNGTAVLEADGIAERRGSLGLQGETGALEFRSLKIRAL